MLTITVSSGWASGLAIASLHKYIRYLRAGRSSSLPPNLVANPKPLKAAINILLALRGLLLICSVVKLPNFCTKSFIPTSDI